MVALCGALLGFLYWNRPPARLFMGDAGSNFLGFLLGVLTVVGTYYHSGFDSPFSVLAPLLVIVTAALVVIGYRAWLPRIWWPGLVAVSGGLTIVALIVLVIGEETVRDVA